MLDRAFTSWLKVIANSQGATHFS